LLPGSGRVATLRQAAYARVRTQLLLKLVDLAAEAHQLALHQLTLNPKSLTVPGGRPRAYT